MILELAFVLLINGHPQIEVLSWMSRTALELVAQSGLGHSFDTLTDDNVPHPYTQSAKQIVYDIQYQCVTLLC